MKKNNISLVFLIILMLFFTSVNNIVAKNSTINSNDSQKNYDRWAVIIGISDYVGDNNDLGVPALDAMKLYDSLISEGEGDWTDENILLSASMNESRFAYKPFQYYQDTYIKRDSDGTRNDILNSLEWLENNADKGDIIFFHFSGHGYTVEDDNGDDLGADEIICPYDFSFDNENNPINFIRDDTLSRKFDEIENNGIESMFINIDSCLGGGTIDWISGGPQRHNKDKYEDIVRLVNDRIEKSNKFAEGISEDIKTNNRVVLSASIPFSSTFSGIEGNDSWISFGYGISGAIENGKKTAEDICKYAIKKWLSNEIVLTILLAHLLPKMWLVEIDFILEHHSIFFPLPIKKDDYPDNRPRSKDLTIIGDVDSDENSNNKSITLFQKLIYTKILTFLNNLKELL